MKAILGLVLIFATSVGGAAEKFVKRGTCGSAKVVSGDTCSNVKVDLNFEGCRGKAEAKARIICEGHRIKARTSQGNFRYEAIFEKSDDGWGATEWKQVQALTEFEKPEAKVSTPAAAVAPTASSAPAAPTKADAPQPPQAAPAVAAAPAAPAANEAYTVKFSAFADVRLSTYKIKDDDVTQTATGYPESGWGIEDGAFYVNFEKDRLTLNFDIPFRRMKNVDSNSTANNASPNNRLVFGYDKAQVYGRYRLNDELFLNVGQFDAIFGVEAGDSKDRVFGKTAYTSDLMIPGTFTGMMLEYDFVPGAYWKIASANSNNKGSLGDDSTKDNGYEYATTVGYANDWIRGQIGGMSRSRAKQNGDDTANRVLYEAMLGGTFGPVSVDLEYDSILDPNKNTLTPADSSDVENSATALMGIVTYKPIEPLRLSLRHEQIDNDPDANTSRKKITSSAASACYRLSPQLDLRVEGLTAKTIRVNDTEFTEERFNFATVMMF